MGLDRAFRCGVQLVKGFVLAGGESKRFGSDKARHLFDGIPMAARVASALEAAGLPVWLVVRDEALADLGIPLLCEALSADSPHPLRGVLTALQSLEDGETALVVPCDLPGLQVSGVVQLVKAGAPSVAVDEAGSVHPLLAHLPGFWAPRVAAVLAVHGSATAALAGARPVPIPEDQLVNWNQPPG